MQTAAGRRSSGFRTDELPLPGACWGIAPRVVVGITRAAFKDAHSIVFFWGVKGHPRDHSTYRQTDSPSTAVSYPSTAVGYPSTAVAYPPTAVAYPPTAVGYSSTAVCDPPTSVGSPTIELSLADVVAFSQ